MSYKLHCPDCRSVIPPENINVQQTIAACPNCAAVFNFANKIPTGEKLKRRKSKKPDNLTQIETETSLKLEIPYLQTMSYKVGAGAAALFSIGFYSLIMFKALADGDPEIVAGIVLSALVLPFIIAFIGSFFAKQTIEVDSEELKHEIRLGVPVYQRKMSVDDVVDVSIEEMVATRESTAEARYNLYADKYDGRQDMFIQNLPEEMAFYAQQALSSYFTADTADDVSLRLQDDVRDEAIVIDEQGDSQRQGM